MLKKVILCLSFMYVGSFMIACDSKEDNFYNDYEQNLYIEQEEVEEIIPDEGDRVEEIIPDEEDTVNESIDYSYVDIAFNNMNMWHEYEGNKLGSISFFTHAPTGNLVFSLNYLEEDSKMVIQRNYTFENSSMIYDEEGSTIRGGILYENYEMWNNSATENEKYNQLKSIYEGHINKKEAK